MTRLWRTLGSVRLAVVLLVLIAAASTVGIVLPQPESFSVRNYLERRLDPRAKGAMKPQEFATLARAAGVLEGDKTLAMLEKRLAEGNLPDQDWHGIAATLAQSLRHGPNGGLACLRLAYVDSFGPLVGRALLALHVHVLFRSVWFRALCGVLLVNLVACSTERLGGQWRMAFGRRPADNPGWYRRRATRAELVAGAGAADAVEKALAANGFRTKRTAAADGVVLEGNRGWLGALGALWQPLGKLAGLGRLGSQFVHLGVVMVMLGGFASRQLSFHHGQLVGRGEVVAVPEDYREAAERDWREVPGQPRRKALFRLKLRRFEFRAGPSGSPEYFGAHVTLLDTTPPTDLTIEVNRPLVYRGFHVYQESYQPDYRQITSVSFLVARVRRAGQASGTHHGHAAPVEVLQQVSLAVPPNARVRVPGTRLELEVVKYFSHWRIPLRQDADGRIVAGEADNASRNFNPAVRVALRAPGLEPQLRWVPLPLPTDPRRPRGVIDYGHFRIIPVGFRPDYATWLGFKTQAAMLPVWLGCTVLMLGIVLCFYCNHERVWALVRRRDDGRDEVLMAGESFKWRERFRQRFDSIVRAVRQGGCEPSERSQ